MPELVIPPSLRHSVATARIDELQALAAAAVALRDQARVAARTKLEVFRQKDPPDSAYDAISREDAKLHVLQRAYDQALSKLAP